MKRKIKILQDGRDFYLSFVDNPDFTLLIQMPGINNDYDTEGAMAAFRTLSFWLTENGFEVIKDS